VHSFLFSLFEIFPALPDAACGKALLFVDLLARLFCFELDLREV